MKYSNNLILVVLLIGLSIPLNFISQKEIEQKRISHWLSGALRYKPYTNTSYINLNVTYELNYRLKIKLGYLGHKAFLSWEPGVILMKKHPFGYLDSFVFINNNFLSNRFIFHNPLLFNLNFKFFSVNIGWDYGFVIYKDQYFGTKWLEHNNLFIAGIDFKINEKNEIGLRGSYIIRNNIFYSANEVGPIALKFNHKF